MTDIEIYVDEMEGLQALMESEEYNTNLVADNPPPVCKDCGDYRCINQECFAGQYDLPTAPNPYADVWNFILNGGQPA